MIAVVALGVGITALVALISGIWALSKLIASQFRGIRIDILAQNEKTNTAITQLQVNEAIGATRLDALESLLKLYMDPPARKPDR